MIPMKDFGTKVKWMDQALINGLMGESIKATISITSCMGMEFLFGLMDLNLLDSSSTIRCTGLELTKLSPINTRGISRKAESTAKVK